MEISTLMKKAPNRTIEPLQSLHHCSDGYQAVRIRIGLAKKAIIPASTTENTSKNEEEAIWIADEWLSSQVGVLQTDERRNCSWQINLSKTQVKMKAATEYKG